MQRPLGAMEKVSCVIMSDFVCVVCDPGSEAGVLSVRFVQVKTRQEERLQLEILLE